MNDRRPPHDPERDTPPEDDLLEAVGEMVREDEATTPRRELLRRLAAGEATDEEIAALEREAETSDEARRDLEAFRPLGPELRERIVERLPKKTAEVTPFPTSDASTPAPPRPMRGAWIPLAAAALLAVAAGLWWLVAGVPGPSADFELAAYSPELSGQVRDQRSGDVEPEDLPTFQMGSTFRLVLRPEHETATDPEFDFYLADEEGVLRPWDVGYARSAEGTVKIEGVLGEDLEISPGAWTFVFVWGEPGELPDPTTLEDVADDAGPWRALSVPFRVVPGEFALGELPLEVRYAGCFDVDSGPVCVPKAPPYDELTFWVGTSPAATIEVSLGDRVVEASPEPVDGGLRFRFPVRVEDGAVEIRALHEGREAAYRLALGGHSEPDWLVEVRRLAGSGNREEARRIAESHLESASAAMKGRVLSFLARLTPAREEKIRYLEEALPHHREEGELLRLYRDLSMLLHFDVTSRDFVRLRSRLDEIENGMPPDVPVESEISFAYLRGILESDVGNHRGAVRALRRGTALATRLALDTRRMLMEQRLAIALQRLGRPEEALEIFRRMEENIAFAAAPACTRARLLNAHAWVLILGERALASPLPLLDRSVELAKDGDCGDETLFNLQLNRALALEMAENAWEAHRAMAEAESLSPPPTTLHHLWWQNLEGRLALAEGRAPDALKRFQEMEALAEEAFEPGGVWRATIEQAESYEHLDAPIEALAAYARAESLLERQSLQVPLESGRAHFAADRGLGTRRHLDLLLRQGRSGEALYLARRSRSRALRSIHRGHRLEHLSPEEQAIWDLEIGRYMEVREEITNSAEDWRLSDEQRTRAAHRRQELRAAANQSLDRAFQGAEETVEDPGLAPLDSRELVLVYHPLPSGWVGIAAHAGRIQVHRFVLGEGELASPQALSDHLIRPFGALVDSTHKIRVLTYGDLQRVDFHALPWQDEILLAHKPVIYGLDLVRSASPGEPRERALVIGDPRADLPAARREADVAATVLRRGTNLDVEKLDGSSATLEMVRALLPQSEVLHWAGHGVTGNSMDGALLLAGGESLTVGDVLALPRAPSQVILSSCETARDEGSAVAGLGIAQAFLVAGAEGVVAALRPVGDQDTEALFRRFYEAPPSLDLAERLRHAQIAWRAENAGVDWASFRLLVP